MDDLDGTPNLGNFHTPIDTDMIFHCIYSIDMIERFDIVKQL